MTRPPSTRLSSPSRSAAGSLLAALVVLTLAIGARQCGSGVDRPGAVEPETARVYVTNESSGDLSIVDPHDRRVVATVPLGKRPRGIQVGPQRDLLYIALSGSPLAGPGVDPASLPPADKSADGIGIFDLRRGELVRVLDGGSDPEQLAVGHDGSRLFVANEDDGLLSVIDAGDGHLIAAVPVGQEPEGVSLSPDGSTVWVTSENDSTVTVIDTRSAKVTAVLAVGRRPRAIAFCRLRPRAFVTAENDAAVTVVDTGRYEVEHTIRLSGENVRPMGVLVSPDDTTAYVTTGRGRRLVAIDVATLVVIDSVEVGDRPWGVAISSDGTTLYTANGPSNDVSVVRTEPLRVVDRIEVGERPWGVAIVD